MVKNVPTLCQSIMIVGIFVIMPNILTRLSRLIRASAGSKPGLWLLGHILIHPWKKRVSVPLCSPHVRKNFGLNNPIFRSKTLLCDYLRVFLSCWDSARMYRSSSLHTLITGNARYVHDEKKALSTGTSIWLIASFFVKVRGRRLCISEYCSKRAYKNVCSSHFYSVFFWFCLDSQLVHSPILLQLRSFLDII
jgi:hypothetical protein